MKRGFPFVALLAVGLALALMATACVSDPTPPQDAPMCEETSDCNSGEVCDEGICYGNPPAGDFAAVLVPSGESGPSLVETNIESLIISPDGRLGDLVFNAPVQIQGKVTLVCSEVTEALSLACGSEAPIDAAIRVERAPAFPGGPRFSQTFIARSDVPEGAPSFNISLPPTLPDRDGRVRNYQVTVTPLDPVNLSGPSAAQAAPPRIELDFAALVDGEVEWKLGEPDITRWISGCLITGAGTVPTYGKDLPVAAYTPDAGTGELVLVSSRGRTDSEGCYSLRVPVGLETVNLRFEPDGDGPAPSIEVIDEPIAGPLVPINGCYGGSPEDTICLNPLRGPNLTNLEEITMPITAQAGGGGPSPVAGATVRMQAVLPLPSDPIDPSRNNRVSASIDILTSSSANANPGQLGQASALAPVNLTYTVSVVPSADSEFAARIAEERRVESGGVQEPIFLGRRVGVSGIIVSNEGVPISGANIVATPSVLFKLAQPNNVRAALDSMMATATTEEDGSFFMWLEGPLNVGASGQGAEVEYALSIAPPFLLGPPTRLQAVVPGSEGVDLGTVALPEAAFARGPVFDHLGEPAIGSELHIWKPTEENPCAAFSLPEGDCPAAATRIGTWLVKEDGLVRVVLPNP